MGQATTQLAEVKHLRIRVPLGTQIMALAAASALVAGMLVGTVMLDRARTALRDEILSSSLSAADLAAKLTTSYLADNEGAAVDLASRPSIQDAAGRGDLASRTSELRDWLDLHPETTSAGITDLDGVGQTAGLADKGTLGIDNRGRDWFQGVLSTGAPFMGAPTRSILDGQPRVPYGVPVRDPAGNMRGVLVIGISLNALSGELVSVHTGATAVTTLLGLQDGMVLVHADPARVLAQATDYAEPLRHLQNGESGANEISNPSGAPMLAAYAPVAGVAWGVLIQEPSADAFAPVNRMLAGAAVAVGGAVILAVLLGTALAIWIGRPLVRLRGAAESMADGDLGRRIDVDREDEIGDLGRAFNQMADQLERTIVEQRQSEERYRLLVECSPEPVLVQARGTVLYANPATLRLLGATSASQVVGSDTSFITDSGKPEVGAFEANTAEPIERQLRTLDGRLVDVEVAEIPTTYQGKPALQLALRDITARKESERQHVALAQSEKLRALGQMATGIAHDLNQSLMLVASYGELARRELEHTPPDIDEVRKLLATATQGALDGGESVKRLLRFTRAPMEGDRIPFDLAAVVHDAVQLTAPRWRDDSQAAGRPISLHVESAGHPAVEASPARISEVMTNLIFNAVDALPSGGTIRIRVWAEQDTSVVEIVDSGMGMSPEVQARIFEPFFTTKGNSGTGLGLAMVFGVVEQYDGKIAVTSIPGEGTSVRISLPRVEQLSPPAAIETPLPTGRGQAKHLRVLTVDDEPAMTRAVVRMLRPAGHVVATAASGEEALEKLTAEPFDVVLSDMGMGPGMNGWELAAAVKASWPEVRVLLATGWGAAIDPAEAQAKGIEAVLSKPYRPEDLDRALAA